jgi:predicted DNA-binding transcriptional regulator AlpA
MTQTSVVAAIFIWASSTRTRGDPFTMPIATKKNRTHPASVNKSAVLRSTAVYVPKKFHLDKRANEIAAAMGGDDELLNTKQMATWLGVSEQWLEVRRVRGDGPPYERLGPRLIRYRVGKARQWLDERAHQSTQEYGK